MDREIRTLQDALSLLDEWQAAYSDLSRDHTRLMAKYLDCRCRLSHAIGAIRNDLWAAEQLAKPIESECPF